MRMRVNLTSRLPVVIYNTVTYFTKCPSFQDAIPRGVKTIQKFENKEN